MNFPRWILSRMSILIFGIKKQLRGNGDSVSLCVTTSRSPRQRRQRLTKRQEWPSGPLITRTLCAFMWWASCQRRVTVIDLIIWIIIRHKQRAFMFPTDGSTLRKWPNPSSWEMRGSWQLSAKQRVPFQAEPCQRLAAASSSSPWNVCLEKTKLWLKWCC